MKAYNMKRKVKSYFSETSIPALEILMSLPATSCTAERSFSTLRRVKTWLRPTVGEDGLGRGYVC